MPPSPPRPKSPKSSNAPKPRSPANNNNSGGTSLRLNLGGGTKVKAESPKRSTSPKPPSGNSPPSVSPSNSKKRKYTPPSNIPPHLALASFARVHHQSSQLSFVLLANQWACQGESILYITDTAPPLPNTTQLAFHLRGTCHVDSVQVETVGVVPASLPSSSSSPKDNTKKSFFETWKASFDHIDPLEHVLIKPATSYTDQDVIVDKEGNTIKYDADAQCTRGAAGMTTGLRAASIASNMGELRMSIDRPSNSAGRRSNGTASPEEAKRRRQWLTEQWKQDLETTTTLSSSNKAGHDLHQTLAERTEQRRTARLKLVAERLAEASDTEHGRRAFKIRIRYHIALGKQPFHAGGLHILPSSNNLLPPHVYTTAGVFGDHEGSRSWLPCLDSASYKHRSSHQLTILVTAPMREGLQIVGGGEDYGVHETWLHYNNNDNKSDDPSKLAEELLGEEHVKFLTQQQRKINQQVEQQKQQNNAPHVIPPDNDVVMTEAVDAGETTTTIISVDTILATQVWASTSWMPVPGRSLGFAIGPFTVVEDPEYFGLPDLDLDEDEMGGANEPGEEQAKQRRRQLELEREQERIQMARIRGEGIRQAYFAPIYERKEIHRNANTLLLEEAQGGSGMVEFQLYPKTTRQNKLSKGLEDAVTFATAGVPHRALSLMRDILALPAYRTAAYTQIWIPGAVNGGYSSGALHSCPEVLGANSFQGGAIMDAGLLPPVGKRIPYFQGGGRVVQMLQARCAIRGWIMSSLPLGGQDDVGGGYIHSLIESFMMSFYERGHGAFGEGGAKGSMFYTKRYAAGSGLNSSSLDFLPVRNVEESPDVAIGGVMAAVPVEDRNNDQLWRSTSNGTESHTSSMDEFAVRQVLCKDVLEALERGTDKDKHVPMPSMGWLGSHLCLSFLSSNATSSSDLGCGSLELVHATGGLVYRSLKTEMLQRVVEGRAGVANFIRLVRAAFIASHLDDVGEKELKMPSTKKEKRADRNADSNTANAKAKEPEPPIEPPKPRFVVCVQELLKKKGLTHTLFTRALQNLAGRIREALLLGRLVDVEREAIDPRTKKPIVDPEGFPNCYVRGSSPLYLRVGVHVDMIRDSASSSAAANPGGIQLQTYAEPVIPEGGVAYSGPITLRVVENEGQFREFVKDLTPDGSRRDWGTTHLHAPPVTTPKAQTAASGVIEPTAKDKAGTGSAAKGIFSSKITKITHGGGYQAIELIRLTNLTPLLWVRVDPIGLYAGRISVFQPDACLAEQLFHDGDAGAQVEAMRNLAERPLRIQGSVKVTSVYDVKVSELPVRVLGDCLRGSPALHSSLPHTPAVRAQAALAIAQWQNNKAPPSSRVLGVDSWLGMNLLIQYFKERYYDNGIIMPVKFTRIVLRKDEVDAAHEAAAVEGGGPNPNPSQDLSYTYLDTHGDALDRATALEEAEEIGVEEDEECRVRAAVITAIASIRAKDGMTPAPVLKFLETILEAEDSEMSGNVVFPDEDVMSETKSRQTGDMKKNKSHGFDVNALSPFPFVSSSLVADSLLALCYINAFPALITDPATGKPVQSSANHPVSKLMEIALRWLHWELYRSGIRAEAEAETMTGVGANANGTVAACAITALSSLAILRQSTTDPVAEPTQADVQAKAKTSEEEEEASSREKTQWDKLDEVANVKFYQDIYFRNPPVSDLTKAACAQAIACIHCASDRFEKKDGVPSGLLSALEFLLDRIIDPLESTHLKHTLSLLMMDACTGKICSMQRVGLIGGRNELVTSAARFYGGPLGASHGGDSGSACVYSVSPATSPAANAVNDGARRGLRLLSKAGHPKEAAGEPIVVRIARFATKLWRTINGEAVLPEPKGDSPPPRPISPNGVCAYDGHLRCSLLSLWQWLWPNRCLAVLQVQAWKSHEGTKRYKELGAHRVMKITKEEEEAAKWEEAALEGINRLVNVEIERQKWRGEMAVKAYEYKKNSASSGTVVDASAAEQGLGQPLPPIQRDTAFKNGGWISSAAQQRRALALDGGTAVTKLRLTVKGSE
ncbi:Peptidase family M1 [Seminavis robusta]|uniref:Peptidase family M1 n=1 Tax=Seminavis robusta TaxID=568900 RepID=A0A9N8E2S5_9STRA|nr:Peptidase family M1 [Seminavis robusta]|eukprot:Sro486_g152700.1 Peptidase family M1 (2011) ;mRNA; r:48866-55163